MPKLNPIVRVFLSAVLSVAGLGQSAVALPLIWVDAGHGGSDPGAIGCGAQEADVTLAVSLKLKALIDSDGDLENARMTRSTDVFVSLAARSANANSAGATRFVSIHNNSCCGASGIETFHYNASPSGDSVNQAQEIQGAMTDTWPALPDRGVKSANFSVLRNTDMPATLSELGFIDNCANDSALLQSPAGQQAAAEAHYQAIRRSLGLGEGVVTPPDTGTLRGTVFEDQGVGTADMSIRLPNARIVVRNSSGATQETTPGGADGVWAFALNSGSWTVTATESGYDPTVQTCVVTGGQTTWCSIGVFPTVVVPPDPDPEPDTTDTDTGTPADTGSATDTGTADDTGTATDTGAPTDTGVATDTGNPQDTGDGSGLPTLGTPGRKSDLNRIDAEGCNGGQAGGTPWALAGVVLLWLGLRRRRRAGLLWSAILGVALAGGSSWSAPETDVFAVERLTSDSALVGPVWSPDGSNLAASRHKLDAVVLIPSRGGEPRLLTVSERAGVRLAWSKTGDRIAYLSPEQTGPSVPALAVDLDGRSVAPVANPHPRRWLQVVDEAIWLLDGDKSRQLSPPGDRYYDARFSPDGRYVVLVGLQHGLALVDLMTDALTPLGLGTHPRFSPDARRLVFERIDDDGHHIHDASVVMVRLDGATAKAQVLRGLPARARRPAVSPDGTRLAFDVDGAIWRARLVVP